MILNLIIVILKSLMHHITFHQRSLRRIAIIFKMNSIVDMVDLDDY